MQEFEYELQAIQRWIKGAVGLNSMRLTAAPPKVARPVILWEAPQRSRARNTARYLFVNQVRQYGRLFAHNLDQLLDYQGRLQLDLEDRENVLAVYDGTGAEIGKLKNVSILFETDTGLDVPFRVEYEVGYARSRPAAPPPAVDVFTRTKVTGLNNE
jgi:hypothetical protein